MTRTTVIAFLALVGTAAADDAYNKAVIRHHECTEAAAKKLALQKRSAYELAREALKSCAVEEAEIANLVSREALGRVLGNAIWVRMRTIQEVRSGPRNEICAGCGMTPYEDPTTWVWRPYRPW